MGSKPSFAAAPKHPGVLKLERGGRSTTIALLEGDQLSTKGLDKPGDVLAHKSGAKHAIDGPFARLLVDVSDHFGGRTLHVVDGFRPPPGHSNHNLGKAIDFRVEGVPVDVVRDYCATLDGAGVGYYPGGGYVHLDARKRSRSWTDDSPPAPKTSAKRTSSTARTSGPGSTHTPSGAGHPSGTTKKP
jgi:hypothetical protein